MFKATDYCKTIIYLCMFLLLLFEGVLLVVTNTQTCVYVL